MMNKKSQKNFREKLQEGFLLCCQQQGWDIAKEWQKLPCHATNKCQNMFDLQMVTNNRSM
jgi:hypothetical protein